ncbi:flagellin [Paracoccus xiamenensis]|uniref:flagellin n=1 Tax=Paracoccus xiamenensis TaxID=2714901 RepID=UPI00140DA89F|nr:flagellin [Paracoccus xiamenensis]NHF72906.1 hypothetical protein [Paracoccus xiamenensis]
MNFVSVGDLSRMFTLRNSNASLRSDIQRLSQEVTTGLQSDIPKHLNGDLVEFSKIEHELGRARAFRRTSAEAASVSSSMQAALGVLQDIADATGGNMLSDTALAVNDSLKLMASMAASHLDSAISTLNTNVGGRFVFSGSKVNVPAVVSADDLVAQAQTVIAGAATADEAIQRLGDWFAAASGAGGFSDTAYQGSVGQDGEFGIDASTKIRFTYNANDASTRKILLGLTIGALVSKGAFDGDHTAQAAMMRAGGGALIEGNAGVALVRSDLGVTEQVIERSSVRLDAMLTNLQLERSNLIQADTYEAGSQLIQAEAQLEALFAMTARLSNLSLAKYL